MQNMLTVKKTDPVSGKYWEKCIAVLPDLLPEHLDLPLEDVIDSIGLLTLRVELEELRGKGIEDSHWLNYQSLRNIIEDLDENAAPLYRGSKSQHTFTDSRAFTVNMPQMAIKALSENWLFKEMGSLHWDTLCKGLAMRSKDICDENGNRLYATFVRIQFTCNKALDSFAENDQGDMHISMKRYGEGIYISELQLTAADSVIQATLMSSFSARQGTGNKSLLKGQPSTAINHITAYETSPHFADEYRKMKKSVMENVVVRNNAGDDTNCIYETCYELNPFYDINGVGLLYFAAYPIINDIGESRYFDQQNNSSTKWAVSWSTADRDVLYYGNCNSDETIIYRLHSIEPVSDICIRLHSSLTRKTDNAIIASVFTLKRKRKDVG